MDPASLAMAAVSLVVPYLQRAGERVADDLGDTAVVRLRELYEAIRDKLRPGTYEGNQLDGLKARPESQGRQAGLITALEEAFHDDGAFAVLIERLVTEASAALGTSTEIRDIEGPVAIGGDVSLRGRYVAGHDMTVGKDEEPLGGGTPDGS